MPQTDSNIFIIYRILMCFTKVPINMILYRCVILEELLESTAATIVVKAAAV